MIARLLEQQACQWSPEFGSGLLSHVTLVRQGVVFYVHQCIEKLLAPRRQVCHMVPELRDHPFGELSQLKPLSLAALFFSKKLPLLHMEVQANSVDADV